MMKTKPDTAPLKTLKKRQHHLVWLVLKKTLSNLVCGSENAVTVTPSRVMRNRGD